MIVTFLLTSTVFFTLYMWWKRRGFPPGPWGLPLLGYLAFLDKKAPYKTLTDLSEMYGPIYGLYLGNVYTVVLSDCKLVKAMLAKDVFAGRAPLHLTHGIMRGFGKYVSINREGKDWTLVFRCVCCCCVCVCMYVERGGLSGR